MTKRTPVESIVLRLFTNRTIFDMTETLGAILIFFQIITGCHHADVFFNIELKQHCIVSK